MGKKANDSLKGAQIGLKKNEYSGRVAAEINAEKLFG